jgi:hypothetical protein
MWWVVEASFARKNGCAALIPGWGSILVPPRHDRADAARIHGGTAMTCRVSLTTERGRCTIAIMLRTQIQLPEPLFQQLKRIAEQRDWSLAELVRRGMEAYVQTCPAPAPAQAPRWAMPVLRGSGGHLADPAAVKPEADAVVARSATRGRRR